MPSALSGLLQQATQLTRAGELAQATALIQRALAGAASGQSPPAMRASTGPAPLLQLAPPLATVAAPAASRAKAPAASAQPAGATCKPDLVGSGAFVAGIFQHAGHRLDYKLSIPPGSAGRSLPLLVMLHGCTQDPDDCAAGTGMNALANRQGLFVLYPAQSRSANPSRCWNWFQPEHQQHGQGEPALLAALTRSIIDEHGLDGRRVYIAGLSAGGAMAAVMAALYPDLFAAAGVHSGLAPGVAGNVAQALSAMKSGAPGPSRRGSQRKSGISRPVPTIVFHGDADRTVHPGNGEQVIALALGDVRGHSPVQIERGSTPAGRSFIRSIHRDADRRIVAEHWLVHGMGHAWSGGKAAGSYTDPSGPDASAQMLRFFSQLTDVPGG